MRRFKILVYTCVKFTVFGYVYFMQTVEDLRTINSFENQLSFSVQTLKPVFFHFINVIRFVACLEVFWNSFVDFSVSI